MDKQNGEKVYQGLARLVYVERKSARRVTYELGNGFRQTVKVAPAMADFILEAWEKFEQTPGESDAPGG